MSQLKIGIVTVYFGKLPEYFPVWMESCRRNPTIDFFVVTDQNVEANVSNVKFVQSSLKQFRVQASKVMGFPVMIETPYKLCDYKPAYGVIFRELLAEYDYWGHCDVDLIWGDLRFFIDAYHLEQYDKFLPLGHLSLYRNTHENNCRFMEHVEGLSDYKKIFKSRQNYLFDEIALIRIYERKYAFFDKIIFADIWPNKHRYTMCTQLKYYPSIYQEFAERYQPINFNQQIFMWNGTKVFQYYISDNTIGKREYMYIHLQKRKWKLAGEFSDHMYISQNRVCAVNEEAMNIPLLIKQNNPYSVYLDFIDDAGEFVAHCWSYFKRKIIKTEPQRIIVENK